MAFQFQAQFQAQMQVRLQALQTGFDERLQAVEEKLKTIKRSKRDISSLASDDGQSDCAPVYDTGSETLSDYLPNGQPRSKAAE